MRTLIQQKGDVDVDRLVEKAAKCCGVDPDAVWGRCRYTEIVRARHSVWCILSHWGMNVNQIAREFEVDHSTINHALTKRDKLPLEEVLRVHGGRND